jgi:lipopolysaccharide export system protein LptA
MLGFAQKTTNIRLIYADNLKPAIYNGVKVMRLTGKVLFKHNKTKLTSDSAFLYEEENSLDAFGHVYINDNDSIHIYGDSLHYDGNSRIAELHGDVILKDRQMTLTTNHMIYDMNTKIAHYYDGGIIINEDNILESTYGYYYSRSQELYFQKSVVLTNPQYVMRSDTLNYHVASKVSYFYGPTWIVSDENSIYCENGWYDTQKDISQYKQNATLYSKSQSLTGDSLYYDRINGFGQGFHNVKLIDTAKNVILQGNYIEYYEHGGASLITDSTMAIMISDEGDSLFLHSDTLIVNFDTAQNAKELLSFHHTKFFRDDLQGKCDSLVYLFQDSIIQMFFQPILWANKSQLSGNFIHLSIKNGGIDRMYIDTNAFAHSLDTLDNFNQVSGRNMIVFFRKNSVYKTDVIGNSQTVYFVRNEAKELVGVNLSTSSDLRVIIDSTGISDIIYLHKPDASLNPIEKLSRRALFLKGFHNYEALRPKTKLEIFNW